MNAAALRDKKPSDDEDLIDEIIRMSDFSFERLPMLDIIGSRMADFLPVALSDLTRTVCEAELVQLDYIPLGQAIKGFPNPVLIAVASSSVLEGNYVVAMDAPFVLSSLEMSLGGRSSTGTVSIGDEGFTAIEKGFATQLAELVLGGLRQSFSVIGDIVPELKSVESDIEAASVAQQASLCIKMEFEVQVSKQSCLLQVVFPYDTIEPIRPQLSKVYFGERGDETSPWRDVLLKNIESATVELEVVLTEKVMCVREIMNMKPGQILDLPVGEDSEAVVMCSDSVVFKCVTGKRNNGLAAIRIVEAIDEKEDSEDDGDTH
jgi:flagellar motor switch protein FliM